MPRLAAIAAAALVLGAFATAHADERRIATLAPEGSRWMKLMEKGAFRVAKATDGRIKTKFYGGGSQGDERDVIRKMRMGQLDGAALTGVGLAMIYPGIRVLQLPFFFADTSELDYVRKKMWPHLQKQFRKEGFELLTPGDVGWIHLFSVKAIRSREELQAAKLWVWQGDPLTNRLTEKLGINGVPLGVPEVLPALASGRIDACFSSPLAAVALQWHTKVRYMSSMRVVYAVAGMVMRKETWDSASAEDIAVQTKIGRKMLKKSLKRIRRDNARALAAMKRDGLQVSETPAEVLADFEAEGKLTWKKGVGDVYTQAELDMVLKYRKQYRDKQANK